MKVTYSRAYRDHAEGHIYLDKPRQAGHACTIQLTGAASMSQDELDGYGETMARALSGKDDVTVWVLSIDHRHGTNVYVHETEPGAKDSLVDYVRENWEDEVGRGFSELDAEPPADDQEAIDAYFDEVADESYILTNEVLLP
jgi:hypothetical protein